MPGPSQSSPGWYPEPDRGAAGATPTLRYWDGRGWTDRRRPQLVLTTLELSGLAAKADGQRSRSIEGPVRTAELPAPAPAAEINASTREAPAGPARSAPSDRPAHAPETASGRGRGVPPEAPGGGGEGGGDGDGDGDGQPARSQRKWWLLAGVAALAAVAVGMAGVALKPSSPGPRVLTDQHFVQLANAECQKTLPSLRPPDRGPLDVKVTPAQSAAEIDAAAPGIDQLADRLAALPAADADKAHIAGWLDGWHSFVTGGHSYADYLRQHGASQDKPPAVLQNAIRLARLADNFARANGLTDCTFSAVPRTDPSTM